MVEIIKVWDRSEHLDLCPGSAVQFTYSASAAFKSTPRARYDWHCLQDRLWVDFNNERFVFNDRPERGIWAACTISGSLYYDEEIEIKPKDEDHFMCSFILKGLNPRKMPKGDFGEYSPHSAKIVFKDYVGDKFLGPKWSFKLLEEYRILQRLPDTQWPKVSPMDQEPKAVEKPDPRGDLPESLLSVLRGDTQTT